MSLFGLRLETSRYIKFTPGQLNAYEVRDDFGRPLIICHPGDLWRFMPEPNFPPDSDFPRDCSPEVSSWE